MRKLNPAVFMILALLCAVGLCQGVDPETPAKEKQLEPNVEKLFDQVRDSIVMISFAERDGKAMALGTGFIISADGFIATNLHVLGEARPITVELADKRKFEVTSVHASDRALDMAIVKIDAKDLPALELGDSDQAKEGQPIVVVGNPQGLRHSVVSCVVSSRRETNGVKMLQIAMPIEPGNSGGPVLDAQGRVLGIVTLKSVVTDNLGFAVEVNHLKPLIEKPNPILMSRWLTIGALDPDDWTPKFGGKWQQRAGRITATGLGDDTIGQRTICVSHKKLPEKPFEVAVTVRLDNESGAAGLIFNSDEGDNHYGFYPSNGQLRLSRFEGPTVLSWTVLREVASEHYRPGEWNHLKVRFEEGKMLCYVNDQLVIESTDDVLPAGKVGLAKFRRTNAEFKGFRVAKQIAPSQLTDETKTKLGELVDALPDFDKLMRDEIEPLIETPQASTTFLRSKADELQQRAAELRRIANDVHVQGVAAELGKLLEDESKADLLRAVMLIARLDDEELDIGPYLEQVDAMAEEIKKSIKKDASEAEQVDALNKYLFVENGFHGGRTNYYHQANSYLSSVLDDREGLPITLSVLYMELGRRIGLKIEGVGLPGHFVVKQVMQNGDEQLIDVFDNGRRMKPDDAANLIRQRFGREVEPDDTRAATKSEIVLRMLANLRGIAEHARDEDGALRYLEATIAVDPDLITERMFRAEMKFRTGRRDAAIADIDWILEHKSDGLNEAQIQSLHDARDFFRNRQPPPARILGQ